jgi:glycosyltransferase involved in cell wall biosynthesis
MAIRQISVIICTHNRAALLPGLINQLRAQDYPVDAFESIVVDNASTDNTRVIVQKLITESGVSIQYVAENRPGITFARNRGAEVAHNPYLAYIDDDCSVEPDWLSQLIQGFNLHDDVVLVGGRVSLDYDGQQIPAWLGLKSERWLAEFNFPGSEPRLLDKSVYVIEGNMALTRQAWETGGGFLGMDQFGNPHVASQEIMYLFEQIKRNGGKVAFVPGAVAYHHKVIPSQRQLLMRAYWNGVSTGILEYLLYRRSWVSVAYYLLINLAATFIFLIFSLCSLIVFNEADAMYHLLRAIRRIGLVLNEMHLVGNWDHIHAWVSANSKSMNQSSRTK